MNYYLDSNKKDTSFFVEEEYIPIQVVIKEEELNKHIGFYYNDTDLAEFVLNYETMSLNKFVLTFTNNFEFIDLPLQIPDSESGEIKLYYPDENYCSTFSVNVYSDGVQITLSDNTSEKYIKSGQIILGLDSDENIVEVLITELNESNIEFIKNELTLSK